jgi:hypothetical protein
VASNAPEKQLEMEFFDITYVCPHLDRDINVRLAFVGEANAPAILQALDWVDRASDGKGPYTIGT